MNNSTAPDGDAPARPRTPAGPREPPGADPAAELEAARQAQAMAEARAAQLEAERDAAVAARESLRSLAAHLIGERGYLAGQLIRAYQRPWRPLKFALGYRLMSAISAASRPVSRQVSARFARSAEKRSPARFDRFLAPPGAPAPKRAPLARPAAHVRRGTAVAKGRRGGRASSHKRSSAGVRHHSFLRKAGADFAVPQGRSPGFRRRLHSKSSLRTMLQAIPALNS